MEIKTKLTKRISIRLTEEQYKTFKDNCIAIGCNYSKGFRKVVLVMPDLIEKKIIN